MPRLIQKFVNQWIAEYGDTIVIVADTVNHCIEIGTVLKVYRLNRLHEVIHNDRYIHPNDYAVLRKPRKCASLYLCKLCGGSLLVEEAHEGHYTVNPNDGRITCVYDSQEKELVKCSQCGEVTKLIVNWFTDKVEECKDAENCTPTNSDERISDQKWLARLRKEC